MFVCRFRWSWLITKDSRLSRHTDPHLDLELTGERGKLPLDLGLERVPAKFRWRRHQSRWRCPPQTHLWSGLSNLHPVVTHTYLLIRSKEIFKMRKRKIANWGSRLLSLNIFRGHWKRIFSRRDYFWQNSNKTKKNLRQIVNVEDKTSQKWQVNFHLSMSIARAINSRFF